MAFKVRLLKEKMINGELAQPNWVYGIDQPTAEAWIAAGDAVQVADTVREFRYAKNAPMMDYCPPPAEDAFVPSSPVKK